MGAAKGRRAVAASVVALGVFVAAPAARAEPFDGTVAGTRSSDCGNSRGDLGQSNIDAASARFNGKSGMLRAALAPDGAVVVADTYWVRVVSGGRITTILGTPGQQEVVGQPQYLGLAVEGSKVYVIQTFSEIGSDSVTRVTFTRILELDRSQTPLSPRVLVELEDDFSQPYGLATDAAGRLYIAEPRPTPSDAGRIGKVIESQGRVDWFKDIQLPITPNDLAVTADGKRAYVAGAGARPLEVNLESAQQKEVGPVIPTVGRVALNGDGTRLFVGDGTAIHQADLARPDQVQQITADVYAGSLDFNPTTAKVVVADLISCTIGTVAPATTSNPPQGPPSGPPVGGTGGDGNPGGGNPGDGNPAGGGQGGSGKSADAPVLTETGAQSGGAGAGGPERVSAPGVGSGGAEGGGSGAGSSAPTDGGGGGGNTVTDPSQLTGTRAEGDFGQVNPLGDTGGSSSASFVPFASGGGQGLGGFAPGPAATDPFSGGGAFAGGGAGPGESVAAAAGAPPAVANAGPVGAAVPPPAATPMAAGSPTPVQGWAGAPGEPAQGATRYAMVAEEEGRDPVVYGLLGLGGCCLLFGIGAGTRRGGRATATGSAPATAKAWAVGR